MKQIEALADKLGDLMLGQGTVRSAGIIKEINRELDELAAKVSGVRIDQLADETMENSPIVLLYWTTRSQLTAQMYSMAAYKTTYYQELDK